MPITLDAVSATANGAATSMTMALTIASTSKVLLAFACNENARSISAMAWNGTTLTRITGVATSSRLIELWALTAPAAGSFNLVSNWTGPGSLGLVGLSYNNAQDVNPLGTPSIASAGAVAAVTLSLSSTTTDLCVAAFAQNTGANTMAVNIGTLRKSVIPSATTLQMIVADVAGAGTLSFSATSTGASAWLMLGIPIIFSAAAATNAPTLTLLGVGT